MRRWRHERTAIARAFRERIASDKNQRQRSEDLHAEAGPIASTLRTASPNGKN
jgi:hypothetical protein